jgi:hypothetical protein
VASKKRNPKRSKRGATRGRQTTPTSGEKAAVASPFQGKLTLNSKTTWSTFALLLIAASIAVFVFCPWVGRYIQGQYFGQTGDYGTDFFRYSQGSVGLIEHGIDPYSNKQVLEALADGRLGTDHPNPFYDLQMMAAGFRVSADPVATGVVSPPFLLVVIYPLVRLCGYTLALNTWCVAIFLGLSWLSVQFWRRLTPTASGLNRLAGYIAMLSLLVFASFPVLWSAIYGQFDVIYFLTIGGSIYLWSFHRNSSATPPLVGLLAAIGGSIKVFPLLMLGYFLWQAVRFYRSESDKPPGHRWNQTMRLPESRVIFYGLAFFVGINFLTGVLFGFDVYGSFFRKVLDLQAEGPGASMKGNLLSYLKFLPYWLFGPFTRLSGTLWFVYPLVATFVVVVVARSIRSKIGQGVLDRKDQMACLSELTLIVAALPTILPHWWIYYNVILILPLMVCFSTARTMTDRKTGRRIMTLTLLAFVFSFSYLTTAVFFKASPGFYAVLIKQAGVDAAIARVTADPTLMERLVYSPIHGQPYVPEFEGRVASLFNFLYGYPGTVFLLIANWMVVRSHSSKKSGHAQRKFDDRDSEIGPEDSIVVSRRGALVTLAVGSLACLVGGYAIAWEGRRRLARNPFGGLMAVEFVLDEHAVEAADQYVDQLIRRIHETNTPDGIAKIVGLVSDLLPPNHFIDVVASTDPALAMALLQQDRQYFKDPAVEAKLIALFKQYQAEISQKYLNWFERRGDGTEQKWRYDGQPGGLLEVLERKCFQQQVPLQRVEQGWTHWQLRFHYEYTWQRALEMLVIGDVPEFLKLMHEHRLALGQHQDLEKHRIDQLRAFSSQPSEADPSPTCFVFVQQPAFTALWSYPGLGELTEQTSLEMLFRVNILYAIEELVRRARVANNDAPHEALTFARATVFQMARQNDQWLASWYTRLLEQRTGEGTVQLSRILQSLSREGLLDLDEIRAEKLLFWDSPLK